MSFRFHTWLVLAAVIVALLLRLSRIDASLGHDEAYTVEAFSSQPVSRLITAYCEPNNHIFHSLLVRLVVNQLGKENWMVRLPALLAGLAAVPVVYLLGQRALRRAGDRHLGGVAPGRVANPHLPLAGSSRVFSAHSDDRSVDILFNSGHAEQPLWRLDWLRALRLSGSVDAPQWRVSPDFIVGVGGPFRQREVASFSDPLRRGSADLDRSRLPAVA